MSLFPEKKAWFPTLTLVFPCPDCGGDGGWTYEVSFDPFTGRIGYADQVCLTCDGTGEIGFEPEPMTIDDLDEACPPQGEPA